MDQLQRVVGLVREVLGDGVVAVYLHGSAVMAGLRPASDVDVLVIAARSLTVGERRALTDGLLSFSGAEHDARPVELLVVVASEITPWRYPPTADYLYGEWLREEFTAGALPRPERMPDLALLLTMAREHARPLLGPPAAEVLPRVPHGDVRRASAAAVPELLAEVADDTRNVLLTLARIWTTLATGQVRSKDGAAAWALERLPTEHQPVLRHVRRLYLESGYAREEWSGELRAGVGPLAARMAAEIDALRD